ncbi:acetyl-CoA synthetase-like protein [Martensiomyces pterosporus]|nr:acetyl-CoA synthetase-like protein [Martensiomyces pterosporus]
MAVFASRLPHLSIPDTNVVEFVLSECEKARGPAHQVFVDSSTGRSLTASELKSYAFRFAAGLRSSIGLAAGDAVAVFALNSINFPVAAYGIVASGAVCTPANPSYTPRELAHQLSDSKCKAIVVGDGLMQTVKEALALTEHAVEHVLLMDESNSRCEGSIFNVMSEDDASPFGNGQPPSFATAPAYICYSSGTTGKPKGVVLTHRNMIANAMQINSLKELDLPKDPSQDQFDTFLGLAPFCHTYGLSYVLHSSVSLGGRVVVMRSYTFDKFLKAVQDYRISFGYLVPPIVCALSKDPRVGQYDLSTMKTILSGGAALSPTLIETTEMRLHGTRVVQAYGMTEMSPAITMLATSHSNPESIGILLSNCESKVVDDDGNELGAGVQGELCFRGPNVMPGYFNNPGATQAIFDSSGYLHTGDIGYVDKDGFFYLTDRKKEIIKFKGFQVAPSELEGILAEHPDIEDAAVMSVYDDNQATEVPKGYFVLKNRGSGDDSARAQAVVDWLHARVANYKKLRGGFSIVDHIPRSPAGKIIRNSLRNIDHVALSR